MPGKIRWGGWFWLCLVVTLVITVLVGVAAAGRVGGFSQPRESVQTPPRTNQRQSTPPHQHQPSRQPNQTQIFINHAANVDIEPAEYTVKVAAGRLLVTANMLISTDTTTLVENPVTGLALSEVILDGQPGGLIIHQGRPYLEINPGRHVVRLTGTIALERVGNEWIAAWTPKLPGVLVLERGINITDAVPVASGWSLSGREVRLSTRPGLMRDADGIWTVSVHGDFIIGAGTTEAKIDLQFESFGMPGETFVLHLPPGFYSTEVEGAGEDVLAESAVVVLRPGGNSGKMTIFASGTFAGDEVDLSGMGLAGVGRANSTITYRAAEGVELKLQSFAGLTGGGSEYRVVREEYQLRLLANQSETTEMMETVISNAQLLSVCLKSGELNHNLTLTLEGKTPQYLKVQLPPETELRTVAVDGIPVKPSSAADGVRIPLSANARIATITYRETIAAAEMWNNYKFSAPRPELPVREYNWEVWLPDNTMLVWHGGPWRPKTANTPLAILERIDVVLPPILWNLCRVIYYLAVALVAALSAACGIGLLSFIGYRIVRWGRKFQAKHSTSGNGLEIFTALGILIAFFVGMFFRSATIGIVCVMVVYAIHVISKMHKKTSAPVPPPLPTLPESSPAWVTPPARPTPGVRRGVGMWIVVILLCCVIIIAMFIALGPQIKNMFTNAVDSSSQDDAKAGLSQMMYGGSYHQPRQREVAPPSAPAELPTPATRAPETELVLETPDVPMTSTDRRHGNVSLKLDFSVEGRKYGFGRQLRHGDSELVLQTIGYRTWAGCVVFVVVLSGLLSHKRRSWWLAILIVAVVLAHFIPGVFWGSVAGMFLARIIPVLGNRLRRIRQWRK